MTMYNSELNESETCALARHQINTKWMWMVHRLSATDLNVLLQSRRVNIVPLCDWRHFFLRTNFSLSHCLSHILTAAAQCTYERIKINVKIEEERKQCRQPTIWISSHGIMTFYWFDLLFNSTITMLFVDDWRKKMILIRLNLFKEYTPWIYPKCYMKRERDSVRCFHMCLICLLLIQTDEFCQLQKLDLFIVIIYPNIIFLSFCCCCWNMISEWRSLPYK